MQHDKQKMEYEDLYAIWHKNFIYECWLRQINLKKYELLTGNDSANFCCTLTGSRKASASKILHHCHELEIPTQIVFFRFIPPSIL